MAKQKWSKANLTNQLRAQLRFYQACLSEREKTVRKIRIYAKYGLSGYKQILARELSGIDKVKKDISNLKVRIRKRYKAGKINEIRF